MPIGESLFRFCCTAVCAAGRSDSGSSAGPLAGQTVDRRPGRRRAFPALLAGQTVDRRPGRRRVSASAARRGTSCGCWRIATVDRLRICGVKKASRILLTGRRRTGWHNFRRRVSRQRTPADSGQMLSGTQPDLQGVETRPASGPNKRNNNTSPGETKTTQ